MKTFVIAVALLLAIALTAVLTAGATVVVLRQWPDWMPARGESGPPVLKSTVEERRRRADPTGETSSVQGEDADVAADRLLVTASPSTTSSADAARLISAGDAGEREEPTAMLAALQRELPEPSESEDRVTVVATPSLPETEPASRSERTSREPSPFGSIDYLKLSTDLQHVSETLERFNNKLLRMIATAESDSERSDVAAAPK